MPVRPENTAPETPERKTVRRKRFHRGCVRKVRHGRRWVWIGKYREDGIGRTKVLGHCADLTEGGAWAKLQEQLRPLNERAGQRLAYEFQGIRFERLPPAETQEMEGLN